MYLALLIAVLEKKINLVIINTLYNIKDLHSMVPITGAVLVAIIIRYFCAQLKPLGADETPFINA